MFLFCFFGCYAATQLALQLRQEVSQVVCSNKEAQKRLAEALPQWTVTLDLMANAYTCTQIKDKQNKIFMRKHGTWVKNTHRDTRISLYRLSYFQVLIVSIYISLCIYI